MSRNINGMIYNAAYTGPVYTKLPASSKEMSLKTPSPPRPINILAFAQTMTADQHTAYTQSKYTIHAGLVLTRYSLMALLYALVFFHEMHNSRHNMGLDRRVERQDMYMDYYFWFFIASIIVFVLVVVTDVSARLGKDAGRHGAVMLAMLRDHDFVRLVMPELVSSVMVGVAYQSIYVKAGDPHSQHAVSTLFLIFWASRDLPLAIHSVIAGLTSSRGIVIA
jgi:hypothetical protein